MTEKGPKTLVNRKDSPIESYMFLAIRGGASPEKVGWKRDSIDGQKVYLMIFMSFLLRNEYRPEESGVDMSTPVHPSPPRGVALVSNKYYVFQ